MAAYASKKELSGELSEWANAQYEAGYSELPEWLALYRGGHEATVQWMNDVGRKQVIRGMFSRSLMVIRDVINPDYLDSKARVIWIAIGTTIVAPFCEEFVFRGCFFRGLTQSWGIWPAAIVSSGLFAFIHGYGPLGLLATFLMGMGGSLIVLTVKKSQLVMG